VKLGLSFFFFSLKIVIHSQPEDEMNVWILEKSFLQTSLGCFTTRDPSASYCQVPLAMVSLYLALLPPCTCAESLSVTVISFDSSERIEFKRHRAAVSIRLKA
jgi:hypothetical protein